MSAVDRMVVRVRGAGYRSLPRRQALALISAGRAEADRRTRLDEPIRQPDPVVITGTPEAIATKMDELAPVNPYDLGTFAAAPGELDADDSAASADDAGDGSWQAERGPIVYNTPEPAPELQYVSDAGDEDVPTVDAVPLPPEPKPSARRGEWADYADSLGVEVTSAMTKREIQQAAEEAAQSLSNLPQPALPGGRLDTPEDEPVTDGSVTDDEDSRTK